MKKNILSIFCFVYLLQANAQQRGDIVSFDSIQAYTAAGFSAEVQLLLGVPPTPLTIQYDFTVYRVRYYTQDYHPDSLTIASALVTIPVNYPCNELGLMSFAHGLCLKDGQVPSNNQISNSYSLICKSMAANGFIGAAPDYIHMSQWSSPGPQAFIHARTEANATIDLFRAIRQYCTDNTIQLSGQVFLSGYSQGGNSTVATAKYMQEQYSGEFNIAAATGGGGSYDLSGICADSLGSVNRKTPERHSLPLVVRSLTVVYEDSLIAWNTGINKLNVIDTVFKTPYRTQLHVLLDRTNPLNDNSFLDSIPARMIIDPILTGFQTDPNHYFRKLLADNDIYDWAPQMPLVLFHSDTDIENPYQNAINTLQKFQLNGAPDVSLTTVNNQTHGAAGSPFVLSALTLMKSKRVDCLSIGVDAITGDGSIGMSVYPNPASDILRITLSGGAKNEFRTIKIFSLDLQLKIERIIDHDATINISELATGTYLLSAEDDNGNKLFKLFCKQN